VEGNVDGENNEEGDLDAMELGALLGDELSISFVSVGISSNTVGDCFEVAYSVREKADGENDGDADLVVIERGEKLMGSFFKSTR
jgi:hypothetical protein